MPVQRRGQVIAFEIGSTGNGRNPIFSGRRQPSCGGTSRMTRECQVRICERLEVKFPGLLGNSPGLLGKPRTRPPGLYVSFRQLRTSRRANVREVPILLQNYFRAPSEQF
jgi:hypothetical protein